VVEDHWVVRKDGVQPPLVADMDSGMSLGTAPARVVSVKLRSFGARELARKVLVLG
jgi:hypothetical protein